MHHTLFEVLFWTGCRVGEALALTRKDIDLKDYRIHISKTFFRSGGKDILSTPKTEQSERTVEIPKFLKNELQEYIEGFGEITPDTRICWIRTSPERKCGDVSTSCRMQAPNDP